MNKYIEDTKTIVLQTPRRTCRHPLEESIWSSALRSTKCFDKYMSSSATNTMLRAKRYRKRVRNAVAEITERPAAMSQDMNMDAANSAVTESSSTLQACCSVALSSCWHQEVASLERVGSRT